MKSEILPIAGDASYRKFYRLTLKNSTRIIVIAKKEKFKNLIVYSTINKFLRNKQILAPRLYSHNYIRGMIVIEDFGDLTFNKVIAKQKNKMSTYKKLVDLLIKIQKIKPRKKMKIHSKRFYVIRKYSFNHLHRESDLFFDWYLPLILRKKKALNIKRQTKKILSQIYNKLNFSNAHFVHRDYHLQNLMKVGSKVGIIDSQDALIGNPAYDLVSLIDDVRVKTPKKLKNQIYDYYMTKTFKIYRINNEKFLQDFKILSVQRSLKIIGIFSRLFKRDNKPQYLSLIPYTWKLLDMRMDSEIFSELKKILNRNISRKIRKKIIQQ